LVIAASVPAASSSSANAAPIEANADATSVSVEGARTSAASIRVIDDGGAFIVGAFGSTVTPHGSCEPYSALPLDSAVRCTTERTTGVRISVKTGSRADDVQFLMPANPATRSHIVTVNSGPGDDFVSGSPANDTIKGDRGNDLLAGNEGDDRILGGAGNDDIEGKSGADSMHGQQGRDTLSGSDAPEPPTADRLLCGTGFDSYSFDPGFDLVRSCETELT
jgi:Ca2+-binding RTX toxin-like protein